MLHGRARPFSRSPAGDAAAAAASTWQAAVIANGGTVSAGRLVIVNTFITAEMAAGTWQLTDDYWGLWAENEAQALTSLKQRRLATAVAAPTFTADRGYLFNGTSQWINTGFIPNTHKVALAAASNRHATYERTDVVAGTYSAGCSTTSSQTMSIRPKFSGTAIAISACCTSALTTVGATSSAGYTVAARRGTTAADTVVFKNGVSIPVTTLPTTVVITIPTFALYLGALNSNGTAGGWRACSLGFAAVGASLSDAQETAQYNNVQAFAAAVGAAIDADVDLWEAAVIANTGTVSAARKAIVTQFVTAEKAAGTWALTDDYWGLWGENAPQALTSLKQRRLATAVAAPVHTVDRGYQFDGATNYMNTLFVPSTMAVAMTGTNLRIAVYERTNLTTGAVSAGCTTSATVILYIGANSSGSLISRTNISAGLSYPLSVNDSRGYSAVSRNGLTAAECFGYKNGVSLVQAGSVTFGATLPAQAIMIGAQNNNGTPANFRPCSIGFAAVGAGLSSAQELAQYTNVQTWATAVGAAV